ncbi:MAG: hypothetical protein AAFW75_09585 [Cyanobacteria bacterium J06636_16]
MALRHEAVAVAVWEICVSGTNNDFPVGITWILNREKSVATVVLYQSTGNRYLLLGAGFGAYQSKKPNWLFGDLAADVDEGTYAMVCVCDQSGKIGWLYSSEVCVESIDGQIVSAAFHQSHT